MVDDKLLRPAISGWRRIAQNHFHYIFAVRHIRDINLNSCIISNIKESLYNITGRYICNIDICCCV